MNIGPQLSRKSPLEFGLELTDGTQISTVGEAADFLSALPVDWRQKSHWRIAIRMLENAFREPAYLKAATASLRTALVMDGLATGIS